MTQSRDSILNRIRQSLKRQALDELTLQNLKNRLATPPVYERPQLQSDLIRQWQNQLIKAAATLEIIPDWTAVPLAVLNFLQQQDLPLTVVIDRRLESLPWPISLQRASRAAQATDRTSVIQAFAGIAETGSVVLLSHPASPTTLNFLPESHLVILDQEQIVAHIEEVWTRLRAAQSIPRTVNIITGPSRTADIEQTLQLGAHGPKRLHVILIHSFSS